MKLRAQLPVSTFSQTIAGPDAGLDTKLPQSLDERSSFERVGGGAGRAQPHSQTGSSSTAQGSLLGMLAGRTAKSVMTALLGVVLVAGSVVGPSDAYADMRELRDLSPRVERTLERTMHPERAPRVFERRSEPAPLRRTAEQPTATLSWEAPTANEDGPFRDEDGDGVVDGVAGYIIYRGAQSRAVSGDYEESRDIGMPSCASAGAAGVQCTFTWDNLEPGRTHYFAVKAYKEVGGQRLESRFSNEASKLLP